MRDLFVKFQSYILVFFGVVSVVSSLGWYITDLKLSAEVAARESDKATYEKAQAEYTAKALIEKQRIEERNRENAEEADARYSSLLGKYNDALRVRYEAARSASSRPDLSGTSYPTEGSDRSGTNPELSTPPSDYLIAITYEDAEVCAVNTARLVVVREWYKEVLGN